MVGHQAPEPGEVGDRRVGEDELRPRVALRQLQRVAPERRDPAPGVDQDRHPALLGQRNQLSDRRLVELDRLSRALNAFNFFVSIWVDSWFNF